MTSPIRDSKINQLLDDLYQLEADQQAAIGEYYRKRSQEPDFNDAVFDDQSVEFFADKLVALDRDKAEFCYQVIRSLRATSVVEVGTSFGVSTIYLAAAIRENIAEDGGEGRVYCSEYEPAKAEIARSNFDRAGVAEFIDLREGDILEQLKDIEAPIDFILMDIWGPIPAPLLKMLNPRLRAGAVIITDNTESYRHGYRDLFEFIDDPVSGLSSMTLPFEGGLEFTVKS